MMVLKYQEYGNKNGPLLIFLHGGGVSSWMWIKQIQYFNNNHCVTIDLPEQGNNKMSHTFSIENSARSVIEITKKLSKGKTITIVGFSLGAQVLVEILSLEPDLVDYSIINSALVVPMRGEKYMGPIIKSFFPLIKNRKFSKIQAKTLYIGDEYFEKYYSESKDMRAETLIRILKENMTFKLPKSFHKARGHILVTVGEKEKQIMKKSAWLLAQNNPNCTGVIIPNVGHGIPLSDPDLFNQITETWLNNKSFPDECIMINKQTS